MKNHKRSRASQRRLRWINVAVIATCATTLHTKAQSAAAPGSGPQTSVSAPLPTHRFYIVQGPLNTALAAYRNQAGVVLKLDLADDKLATLQSSGVQGVLTAEQALRQLLANTGIGYQFTAIDHATVGLQSKDTVEVTAGNSCRRAEPDSDGCAAQRAGDQYCCG